MNIVLFREDVTPTVYSIKINNSLSMYAKYNSIHDTKEIFDIENNLIGYSYNTIYHQKENKNEVCTFIFLKESTKNKMFLESFLWQSYYSKYKNNIINIIPHRGIYYSFFINNKQVASYCTYDKEFFSRKLVIELNDDLDPIFFIQICLELYSDFSNEGKITKSPYNLWFQKSRFNKLWKPKPNTNL